MSFDENIDSHQWETASKIVCYNRDVGHSDSIFVQNCLLNNNRLVHENKLIVDNAVA